MILTPKTRYEFEDLAGQCVETEDPWLNRRLNGHICFGKGGNRQPTHTTQEVIQTNLPEYLEPYIRRLANRAESEYGREYTPYEGDRIAGLTPDTLLANEAVRRMVASGLPGVEDAMGHTRAGLGALAGAAAGPGSQPYQFSQYDGFDETGFRSPYQFGSFDFEDVAKFTDDGVVEEYMSPYMQGVVDRQKAAARDDYLEESMRREAGMLGTTGGLDSSRAFLVNQAAESDYLDRLADIDAAGHEKAFEMAMSQFASDRDAGMSQEQMRYREQAERMMNQADEYARAGDQVAAEKARVQAAEYEDYARTQAAQAGEDRLAAQFGVDAVNAGLAGSAQLARLEEMARAGDAAAVELLGMVGKEAQARDQAALDMQYEDFARQRDYSKDQLTWLSEILRGMPSQMGVEQQRMVATNPAQQLLGAGIGGLGLWKALGMGQ